MQLERRGLGKLHVRQFQKERVQLIIFLIYLETLYASAILHLHLATNVLSECKFLSSSLKVFLIHSDVDHLLSFHFSQLFRFVLILSLFPALDVTVDIKVQSFLFRNDISNFFSFQSKRNAPFFSCHRNT